MTHRHASRRRVLAFLITVCSPFLTILPGTIVGSSYATALAATMPRPVLESDPSAPLPVATCRRLLGSASSGMSDQQICRLRDDLYEIAEVAVTLRGTAQTIRPDVDALAIVSDDERDLALERAAIFEFDAGFARGTATRRALAETMSAAAKKGRRS